MRKGLLLCVEHHLLVCPLGELGVGVEVGPLRRHLALGRVAGVRVNGIGLLVRILIKGGVKWLGLGIPAGLLLLHRVRIRLGVLGRDRGWGWGRIVGWGRTLARDGRV